MDTYEKLKLLAHDSQYDLACACGTNKLDRRKRGDDGKWLYPVTLPQGGTSVIMKTLLSNVCANDCKYCPLRSKTNVQRCSLHPEEVAKVFMDYIARKKVFGLFLSSGVINNPDFTMDRLNAVARILRYKHKFKGYIHLKVIPGASDAAIENSLSLASAVSLNIETPGESHFKLLSEKKNYNKDIIRPLKLLGKLTSKGMKYSRVKITSQFIVGASDESDKEIVNYMSGMYDRLNFNSLYFSSYQKGLGDESIPGENNFQLTANQIFTREHRLYQVDFLLRKYGFSKEDIICDNNGNLNLEIDPKQIWANNHPEFFPVRINSADKFTLLRVPGLGTIYVNRILKFRKTGRITSLANLKIKGKLLEKIKKYAIIN